MKLTPNQLTVMRDTLGIGLKKGAPITRNNLGLFIGDLHRKEVCELLQAGLLEEVKTPQMPVYQATEAGIAAMQPKEEV